MSPAQKSLGLRTRAVTASSPLDRLVPIQKHVRQSAKMPAFLMIGSHLAISALRYALCASGVWSFSSIGSVPRSAKRSFTVASCRATLSALFSRLMIGCGVPFGAYRPCHTPTAKPGSPASCAVGTSASDGTRFVVETAYTLTLPALIWLVVLVVWSHIKST